MRKAEGIEMNLKVMLRRGMKVELPGYHVKFEPRNSISKFLQGDGGGVGYGVGRAVYDVGKNKSVFGVMTKVEAELAAQRCQKLMNPKFMARVIPNKPGLFD